MQTVLKYSTIILLSAPVALYSTCTTWALEPLESGVDGLSIFQEMPLVPIGLAFLVGITIWSSRASSLRKAVARVFWALMIAGLLTPVPQLYHFIANYPLWKDEFGNTFWLFLYLAGSVLIGGIVASIGFYVYRSLLQEETD